MPTQLYAYVCSGYQLQITTPSIFASVTRHGVALDVGRDMSPGLRPGLRFVMDSAPRGWPSVADVPFLPYVLYWGVDPRKQEMADRFLAYLEERRGVIVIPGVFLSPVGRSDEKLKDKTRERVPVLINPYIDISPLHLLRLNTLDTQDHNTLRRIFLKHSSIITLRHLRLAATHPAFGFIFWEDFVARCTPRSILTHLKTTVAPKILYEFRLLQPDDSPRRWRIKVRHYTRMLDHDGPYARKVREMYNLSELRRAKIEGGVFWVRDVGYRTPGGEERDRGWVAWFARGREGVRTLPVSGGRVWVEEVVRMVQVRGRWRVGRGLLCSDCDGGDVWVGDG